MEGVLGGDPCSGPSFGLLSLPKTVEKLQTDLNPTEVMVCVRPIWAGLGVRGGRNLRTTPPALGIAGSLSNGYL